MSEANHKKVLIITYYWPPAGGPGVQRWVKFAKYLYQFGFEPFVITVKDSQASYAFTDLSLLSEIPKEIKVFKTSTRELYNAYLKITKKQNIPFSGFVNEGIPGLKQKIIRFLRSHLFIPDPRKGWNRFAYSQAITLIEKEKIHHLITTSPPHSTQLIGRKLKARFPQLQWMADFRDPWTDVFYFDQLCHSWLSKRINLKMELSILERADNVTVVSRSMKSDFIKTHNLPDFERKITILANGFDTEDFPSHTINPDKNIFTIAYTGTLANNYRLDAFLTALQRIVAGNAINIKLKFIGEICPEYRTILESEPFSKITELIARVPHEEAIRHLFQAHMLLLVIPDAPKNESIVTGKLFEYLAARKIILGIGPVNGDAAEILNSTQAGKMFDYSDNDSVLKFLNSCYERFKTGENLWSGINIEKYSRENLTRQLTQLF